jgi:23S rRNA (guanosine2251-2'-O)-methyltransferase
MSPIRKRSTREIYLINEARTPPSVLGSSVVVLHNIRSLYNVGSAFRTADAFGISGLVLSGYTPCPPRAEISKTALGAEETVHWSHFDSLTQTLDHLRSGNHFLVGVEQTESSHNLPEYRWPAERPLAIFFGNEVTGLDEALLEHLDQCVEIPQFGKKHSLNISVSFGIVLYDMICKGTD